MSPGRYTYRPAPVSRWRFLGNAVTWRTVALALFEGAALLCLGGLLYILLVLTMALG